MSVKYSTDCRGGVDLWGVIEVEKTSGDKKYSHFSGSFYYGQTKQLHSERF